MKSFFNFLKSTAVPSDKNIQNFDRFSEILEQNLQKQDLLLKTLQYFIMAMDSVSIAMWVKDQHDRYITANKKLRDQLFEGHEISYVIGKTDNEIIFGKAIDPSVQNDVIDLTPEKLPNIKDYINNQIRICNFTDLIVKTFKKPSLFIEIVNGLTLIVYKYPMFKEDKLSGTFGYYYDVTKNHDNMINRIKEMEACGEAFQIDGTGNYYLTEFRHPNFSCNNFL